VSEKNPLDRLTRPGGRVLADDESIPVLTERLTLPSIDLDISLPQPPPPVTDRPASPAAAPSRAEPPAPLASATAIPVAAGEPARAPIPTFTSTPRAEIDWAQIEQAMRDAVFRELQPALADEALRVLRERLQPAVERALQVTASELRQAFESRLREAIGRAVRAEIARQRERT